MSSKHWLEKGCLVDGCHYGRHGRSVFYCDGYDDNPVLSSSAGSVLHCTIDQDVTCSNYRPSLNPDVLNLLIQRGADVNAIVRGCSVVCFALQMGCETHFIKVLLEAGSLLNASGCITHGSPFICAMTLARPFRADVVEMLLKEGASVDQVDDQGQIPLQQVLKSAIYETNAIEMFLDCQKGMNLNSLMDKRNNSLLQLAVSNSKCKSGAVKLLVQRGVKVDTVNMMGITPLNTAVQLALCPPSVIKFLLKNGAKVQADSMYFAINISPEVEFLKLLWVASASISETSYRSILERVLHQMSVVNFQLVRRCYQLGFRFLVRVYFLHVSDYCLHQFLNSNHVYYQDFLNYRDQCVPELLSMKLKNVGRGHTLHDFLRVCSSPYEHAENREKMYGFDQLLEAIANDAFPLYFEIIACKVGKREMKAKLQNVRMSAPKFSPTNALAEEIVLPYDVMLKISHYLGKEDLMRLILAYSNFKVTEANKRKAELSELCCKLPRLN